MRVSTLCLLTIVGLAACDKQAAQPPISKEDRALLEKLKAREDERERLVRAPWMFIEAGTWASHDKGIINDYTRATSTKFTNKSSFDVTDLKGRITYMNESGAEMATVPFTATGELRAGQQAYLQLTTADISGKAVKAVIKVESVHVRR